MSLRSVPPTSTVLALPPSAAEAVRAEIHAALASVRRLEAELSLAIGERLAWLKDQDRFRDSDLRTFGDYTREIFRLSGATAWERMSVCAIVQKHEPLDRAYREGRLAARSVMDVGRVLEALRDPGDRQVWIRRALTMTSRELRASIEAERPGVEIDEERERFSYEMTPALRELEVTAKDLAEKMQGRDLSQEAFIRTVVDELADLPDPAARMAEAGVMDAETARLVEVAVRERRERAARDADRPREVGARESEEKEPRERPLPSVFVTEGDIIKARTALTVVTDQIACMRIRIRHKPRSIPEAEAGVRHLLRKEQQFRILKASIVRIFARIGPVWFSGWGPFYDAVGDALGVSKRSAEMLNRDAYVYENSPKIRKALDKGWITSGQIALIGALPRIYQDEWIWRAREASPRGFERCVKVMLRVHSIEPLLFHGVKGRLAYRPLMARLLRLARSKYGISTAEIRGAMRRARLDTIDPEEVHSGSMDPWEHIVLLRRLEVLLDLLGARIWRAELPAELLAQMSKRTKRVTRTFKASTKAGLLDVLGKIAIYAQLDRVPCGRSYAMTVMYRLVIAQWSLRDPAHRVDPVFERDDCRCMVPSCGARGFLHDHHIDFRSQGGSNAPHNRIALCIFHHGLVHEGRIAVCGRADGVLLWRLGQSTPRYYRGYVRLPVIAGGPERPMGGTRRSALPRRSRRPAHPRHTDAQRVDAGGRHPSAHRTRG